MEAIKIKHREFQLLEQVSENSFLLERKGKKFFARKFEPKTQDAKEMCYAMRKLATSGVKVPKLYYLDEKAGYAVYEHLEGMTMMEYLSSNEMIDCLYEQLYKNAYYARINKMTLNYEPDKWMLADGVLYYVYPMFILYQKEKDLVERYIRLWFNTKELSNFMTKNGVFYDKSRIKDECSINKEIVLIACKYYR